LVYTCGALVHAGRLILPYGMSDTAYTIVTVELENCSARSSRNGYLVSPMIPTRFWLRSP